MWGYIVFWIVANFVGVTLEALANQLSNTPQVQQREVCFVCCNDVGLSVKDIHKTT